MSRTCEELVSHFEPVPLVVYVSGRASSPKDGIPQFRVADITVVVVLVVGGVGGVVVCAAWKVVGPLDEGGNTVLILAATATTKRLVVGTIISTIMTVRVG